MKLAVELQQLQLQVAKNLKEGVAVLRPRRRVLVEVKDDDDNFTYDTLHSAFARLKEDINIDDIEMWLQGIPLSGKHHGSNWSIK